MNLPPAKFVFPAHPQIELDGLLARLREAEETLDAIRYGRVDALVVSKNSEEQVLTLQGAKNTYRLMVEAMSEGVITVAPDGTILYCNPCFSDMLKTTLECVAGKRLQDCVAPADIDTINKMLSGSETQKTEIWLLDQQGDLLPVLLSVNILHVKGEPAVIYMVAMDLTLHKRYEARLEYQANYDTLTGLANRNRLTDRLRQAIVLAERYGHQVAVAFIDLDQFKFINDSLGHHIGDKVLVAVAARLKSCVRENDTIARHGGDEFVVVIDHSDESVLSTLMARILSCIAEPILVDNRELQVTCSIGFSVYPIDGLDVDALLKNADAAMYRAKEQGRNNVQFYTEELNQKIRKRLAMESMLRQALERGEFFLNYQPQVDLKTGVIIGVEALVRWNHETEGTIAPCDFIPLAEELGLIVPIGEWVLRTACTQTKAWQEAGFSAIGVAVNISARQFRQKDLAEMIARILQETGLEPCHLEIELTESMVMQNVEAAIATLESLKGMGIRLSIDDFGTGYSSLNYLKRFPIDVLKIDQSFVRDIVSDDDDAAIACSIIALAHALKLKVIAEGVETVAQLNYLAEHHCDAMQGYYFSRPLSASACGLMFREGKSLTKTWDDFLLTEFPITNKQSYLKKSEHSKSNQLTKELIDFLPIAVFIKDKYSQLLYINKTCSEVWGLHGIELNGPFGDVVFPEEQVEEFKRKDQEIFADGAIFDFEEVFWHAGLKCNRNGHSFKKPIYDSGGEPLFMVCATIDITDAKRSIQELRLSEDKLRKLYETAPVGIARNSMDGQFIEVNQKFSDMVGYTIEQLNALTYWDLTPVKYKDQEKKQIELLSTAGQYGPYEKEFIHSNGNAIPVKLNGVQISDGISAPYIWSFIEDISQRVELERTKSEFISTVSHELRTPLTSIGGALSLVSSGVLGAIPDSAKKMLEMAYRNSLQLTTTINDLLEIDKLAAGKMALSLQSQPLLPLIRQSLEFIQVFGAKYDVSYDFMETAADAALCAEVDSDRLLQVLSNLLSNAAKFSHTGGRVEVSMKKTGANRLRVDVINYGPEIPEEFRDKIFQKFYQLDMSATKNVGGSGLGLAICKELVEHMHGEIGFDSLPGRGTDFYIEFPIALPNLGLS